MTLNRQQIQKLIGLVIDTRPEEVDCDGMIEVLTEYAERLSCGETDESGDEMVRHHLSICPECREEFEMVKGIADEGNLSKE